MPAMGFFIECDKCKKVSPEIVTVPGVCAPYPEGWTTKTEMKGISYNTTFICPECK